MIFSRSSSGPQPAKGNAFTLMEIMVVLAIMGLILGIGIPSMVRAMRKDGMRAAIDNVVQGCQQARAAAILSRQTTELVFNTKTRELKVVASAEPPRQERLADGSLVEIVLPPEDRPKPPVGTDFSAVLPDGISVELLDVNFLDMKGYDEARIRFHPNSTSDEFSIVLRSSANEWRKISLDVLTGIPDVEMIR